MTPGARPAPRTATSLVPHVAPSGSADAADDRLGAVMHWQATTVALVTAGMDAPVGFCATSVAPVCMDPPILSFAIRRRSSSWPVLETASHAMVHLLADDQADLARRFGTSGRPRFGPDTRWSRGMFGLPVIEGALAWLLIALADRVLVDDHMLVVGRVVAARHAPHRRPLLRYRGCYWQAGLSAAA